MKGYSTLLRAHELEPHHKIQFHVITYFCWKRSFFYPSVGDKTDVYKAPQNRACSTSGLESMLSISKTRAQSTLLFTHSLRGKWIDAFSMNIHVKWMQVNLSEICSSSIQYFAPIIIYFLYFVPIITTRHTTATPLKENYVYC